MQFSMVDFSERNSGVFEHVLVETHKTVFYEYTVKPVLSDHSKRSQKCVFKTGYCLMQVKSIAECSAGAFCNTFDLH